MQHLKSLNIDEITAESSTPDESKVLSGCPEFTTWNAEETSNGIYCGVWQSTSGKWKIKYDEWEFFHILEGHSIIEDLEGNKKELKAGESFIIQPGFEGSWEVIETTRKEYVIKLP